MENSLWISVKDRLPPDDKNTYILAYGIPTCGRCRVKKLTVIECRYSNTEGGFFFGEYDCPIETTHWMNLPDAPK